MSPRLALRATAVRAIAALAATLSLAAALPAQPATNVPTPSAQTGLAIGADRVLADWRQITGYFSALAAASPSVRVDTLGTTTQGRPFIVATISSPRTFAIARRFASGRRGSPTHAASRPRMRRGSSRASRPSC